MNAKQLEIKLKDIDIKFLEDIIHKLFVEDYDNITQNEAKRIYKILCDKKEE